MTHRWIVHLREGLRHLWMILHRRRLQHHEALIVVLHRVGIDPSGVVKAPRFWLHPRVPLVQTARRRGRDRDRGSPGAVVQSAVVHDGLADLRDFFHQHLVTLLALGIRSHHLHLPVVGTR